MLWLLVPGRLHCRTLSLFVVEASVAQNGSGATLYDSILEL